MKRLDINITDRLNQALNELREVTGSSKTELVHDAIAMLDWVKKIHERGHEIGEINPSTNEVVSKLFMSMFSGIDKGARVDE